MIGGFSTYWFHTNTNLSYPLAILAGVIVTLLGLVLWTFIVLPLWRRRSPPYVILLGTIVYGAILSILALLILGSMPQTLPPWIPGFELEFAGSRVQGQYIIIIAVTLIMMTAVSAALRYTTLGRAMRACAASRDTSELLGISAERMGFVSFAITAALGGLAGAVITPAQFTSADVGLPYGVFGFVAAVLGGFGTMSGALVGGILLGVVNAFVGRYISSNYQTVIAFAMLLTLLAVRPQGITGRAWEESEV
jgi:branched-chain amino acid transport system permease protein